MGLRDGGFLGHEEGVLKRGLISLNAGWLARGGLLRLHEEGLSFTPNPLERLLGARGRRIAFADLDLLERMPGRPGEFLPGGLRPRIRLHLRGGGQVDLLPAGDNVDDWLDAIRERRAVWLLRCRLTPTEDATATAR